MKKVLAVFMASTILFLSGCFSNTDSMYINTIIVTMDGETKVGTLKFFDGSNWIDYDGSNQSQTEVYFSFDVQIGEALTVVFDTYSPDIKFDEMKMTLSKNLDYETNTGAWATVDVREGDFIPSRYEIDEVTTEWNVITVYGWLTDHGPKYVGAKNPGTHYVVMGIHLNYPDQ